jgi:hypothetical protein
MAEFYRSALKDIVNNILKENYGKVKTLFDRFKQRLCKPPLGKEPDALKAFQQVITQPEFIRVKSIFFNRLPEEIRWWAVSTLCQGEKKHPSDLMRLRHELLSLKNYEGLENLYRKERICPECKVLAVKNWLLHNKGKDCRVLGLLTSSPELLDKLPEYWAATGTSEIRFEEVVHKLFNAAQENKDKVAFFARVCKWQRFKNQPDLCQSLLEQLLFLSRNGSPVPWSEFFCDPPSPEIITSLLGARSQEFWEACCDNLDGSCLFEGNNFKMLQFLYAGRGREKIHLQQKHASELEHWIRISNALTKRIPSSSSEWDTFFDSIKCIRAKLRNSEKECILQNMLNSIAQSFPNSDDKLEKVVECAKLLFPERNAEDRVSLLIKVARRIKPPDLSRLQYRLVLLFIKLNEKEDGVKIVKSLESKIDEETYRDLFNEVIQT